MKIAESNASSDNQVLEEIRKDPKNVSSFLTAIKLLQDDVAGINFIIGMPVVLVQRLSKAREGKEGNLELVNSLLTDVVDRLHDNESVIKSFKDYFRDIQDLK